MNTNKLLNELQQAHDIIAGFIRHSTWIDSPCLRNGQAFKDELFSEIKRQTAKENNINKSYSLTDPNTDTTFMLVEKIGQTLHKSNLGAPEHQFFLFALAKFTELKQTDKNNLILGVRYLTSDYAKYLNYDLSDTEQQKAFKQKVLPAVDNLRCLGEDPKELRRGLYGFINYFQSIVVDPVKGGYIEVMFTEYLVQKYLRYTAYSPLQPQLFLINGRAPTCYSIAYKLIINYNMLSNRDKNSQHYKHLSLDTILKQTKLPTEEDLKQKRQSFKNTVRNSLKQAFIMLMTEYNIIKSLKLEQEVSRTSTQRSYKLVAEEQRPEETAEAYINRITRALDKQGITYSEYKNLRLEYELTMELDYSEALEERSLNRNVRLARKKNLFERKNLNGQI